MAFLKTTEYSEEDYFGTPSILDNFATTALQLHFIQCPFPNQIQFGLEKLHPKIAYDFPNQIQIGLENFDDHCQCPENSKPNSVWFGKIIDRILSRTLFGGLIVTHLPLDILALLRGLRGALVSRGLKA